MTIQALITKVKEEKPNSFSNVKLLSFVNEIEEDVAEQLNQDFVPYESVAATDLLVPAPYDRLYVSYVKAMIDFSNEEYASYQLNQEQHVQDFRDFTDWVVREGKAADHVMPQRLINIF